MSKSGDTILVKSTADGEMNGIDLAIDGANLVVTDHEAGEATGANCSAASSGVACATAGVARVRIELGPGSDYVDASTTGLRLEILGEDGVDDLTGGDAGDLLVGGSGQDWLDAGAGNDRIESEDGEEDADIDCGPGDDDLDDDLVDPFGTACEVVAPEMRFDGPFGVTGDLTEHGYATPTDMPQVYTSQLPEVRWLRCAAAGAPCSLVETDTGIVSYHVTSADVGYRLVVEIHAANRAGTKTVRSNPSAVVAARVTPSMPVLPEGPPVFTGFPPVPPEFAQSIANAARWGSTRALESVDLRKLAKRKSLTFSFDAPADGTYAFRLTLPAAAARKLGVRGGRPLTVATGRLVAKSGADNTFTVVLTPTKNGRKVMKKARRLALTLRTELKTNWAPKPFTATSPLTLKRR